MQYEYVSSGKSIIRFGHGALHLDNLMCGKQNTVVYMHYTRKYKQMRCEWDSWIEFKFIVVVMLTTMMLLLDEL